MPAMPPSCPAPAAVEAAPRPRRKPTVPSRLSEEIANQTPFLCGPTTPADGAALGMKGADPAEVFAEIRSRKDRF